MSQSPRLQSVRDMRRSDTNGIYGIPQAHDRAARRLFSHPQVVADLLRGLVPQGALREFDPCMEQITKQAKNANNSPL